jgi:hypothetical protein
MILLPTLRTSTALSRSNGSDEMDSWMMLAIAKGGVGIPDEDKHSRG